MKTWHYILIIAVALFLVLYFRWRNCEKGCKKCGIAPEKCNFLTGQKVTSNAKDRFITNCIKRKISQSQGASIQFMEAAKECRQEWDAKTKQPAVNAPTSA